MKTEIRRFVNSDAKEISVIIHRCFNEILMQYHDKEMLQMYLKGYTIPEIIRRASFSRVYTVLEDDVIVGTGTISHAPSRFTSLIEGIYISPDYQGNGYGRKIIHELEQDQFYKETIRTELHATKPGAGFYRHLGYFDIDKTKNPDAEGLYVMEKYHLDY